jgi:predicted RNase H-like nuclease (RuvC/YqgF family)
MNTKKSTNGSAERLKIQEKALSNLADTLKKQESEYSEEIRDIQAELKALKMFLTRAIPEFKKQFPEIQRKLK